MASDPVGVCSLCVEGASDDPYLEKSLGHVTAWLHDTRSAEVWNKGPSHLPSAAADL